MPFSAAAPLPFTALAPLFTLLSVFVSAPASSLPGAWTSAPAPTSPFPEIVHSKSNILEITVVSFLFFYLNLLRKWPRRRALTSYFGHRAR